MLYDIGLDNIAVLDSGLSTWAAGGREISVHRASYPPANLLPKRRENVFVGKMEVHGAIKNEYVCTMNALNSNIPQGDNLRYGRPGHIPGIVKLPAGSLQDGEALKIRPAAEVAKAFADVGANPDNSVIVYCGYA